MGNLNNNLNINNTTTSNTSSTISLANTSYVSSTLSYTPSSLSIGGSNISYSDGCININYDATNSLSSLISSITISEFTLRALLVDPNLSGKVPMNVILRNQKLSKQFIQDYYSEMDKDELYRHQEVDLEIIEQHINDDNVKPVLDYISQYQKITESFIKKHKNKIDFKALSSSNVFNFTEKFIMNNIKKLDMNCITRNDRISDTIINSILDKLDPMDDIVEQLGWKFMSWGRRLTEENIYKYIDYIDFSSLNLSAKEFKDERISCYRKLKYGF